MHRSLLAAVLVLTGSAASAQTADRFFALEWSSNRLVSFDATGTNGRTIGFTGLTFASALVLAPDGYLYTFTASSSNVYRVDPADASVQLIGSLGFSTFEGGMTIASDGTVYATNEGSAADTSLFTVDLSTGAGTLIGSMGRGDVNGIAWRSDGMIVGIERESNALVEIDPQTASMTVLAALPTVVGAAGGMTIDGGKGWFTTSGTGASIPGSHEFWTFDPFTGVASFVRDLPEVLDATGVSGLTGGSLLTTSTASVASAQGIARELRFVAPDSPRRLYLTLGSTSGTEPGFLLSGRHVPLTPDGYLLQTLFDPASTPMTASFGFLDASGAARISFSPPPQLGIGSSRSWHHSVLTLEPGGSLGHVSNPAHIGPSRSVSSFTGPALRR